jgi:hypothetical protein
VKAACNFLNSIISTTHSMMPINIKECQFLPTSRKGNIKEKVKKNTPQKLKNK